MTRSNSEDRWASHARPLSALNRAKSPAGRNVHVASVRSELFGKVFPLLIMPLFGWVLYRQWSAGDLDMEAWYHVVVVLLVTVSATFAAVKHVFALRKLRLAHGEGLPVSAVITSVESNRANHEVVRTFRYEYWIRGRLEHGFFTGGESTQLRKDERIVVRANPNVRNSSVVCEPDYYTTKEWYRERVALRRQREAAEEADLAPEEEVELAPEAEAVAQQ